MESCRVKKVSTTLAARGGIDKTLSEADKQTRAFALPSTNIFTGDLYHGRLLLKDNQKKTMILSV